MRNVRINRGDPDVAFLSRKVKGDVVAEIPDGIQRSGAGEPSESMTPALSERFTGARSGSGKQK